MPRRSLFGFTLIELMVVVSIIGTLATIGFVTYQNNVKNATDVQRRANVEAVAKAYEISYNSDASVYRNLVDSDFSSGKKPADPNLQYLEGPDAPIPTSDKFKVCTNLKDNSSYCRSSTQSFTLSNFPTITPTLPPTSTPFPTATPAPVMFNQTADYSSSQGNRGWYYYFTHEDNLGAPWAATYGFANTMQMVAWYGEPSNNYWYDCNWCWGSITATRAAGGDFSRAIIYWKAPQKGLATMVVNQTRVDTACNGNGYYIGLGYAPAVGSWVTQPGTEFYVGACDMSTKNITLTKQMNGGDSLLWFESAWRWTWMDMSIRSLTVSFIPN